jgi:predicted hydrocarbon binding protein
MAYRSSRRLCGFAEGLIRAAARHYREDVRIDPTECAERGSGRCLFRMRFSPEAT